MITLTVHNPFPVDNPSTYTIFWDKETGQFSGQVEFQLDWLLDQAEEHGYASSDAGPLPVKDPRHNEYDLAVVLFSAGYKIPPELGDIEIKFPEPDPANETDLHLVY